MGQIAPPALLIATDGLSPEAAVTVAVKTQIRAQHASPSPKSANIPTSSSG
jgi:hypothetical protein